MGTVTKSIGTSGRDYSTIQSWHDALPANLVTDGNHQVGELYNDTEFVAASTFITFASHTTDSTHTITLKCASGQAWYNHASVQTNRFAYSQSKGVGLRLTGGFASAILISIPNVFLDGLQIKCTAASTNAITANATASNVRVDNCIIYSQPASNQKVVNLNGAGVCTIANCLVVVDTDVAAAGIGLSLASKAVNCTIVRPSNKTIGGSGLISSYGAAVSKNNAIFGFSNASSNGTGGSFTGSNNCTDLASGPSSTTSNQVSKTYANQFVATSTASSVEDFRPLVTSSLYDNGVTDTTNVPSGKDAAQTTRPQGSAWDIGAYEYKVIVPTSVTLTGPTSGYTGVASSNFTVTLDQPATSTIVVTPGDAVDGGTFTPSTVSITSTGTTGTFTYTAATPGTKTITVTNNASLSNIGSISFVATNPATPPTGTVTSTTISGQTVTISGTTTNVPTSGTATLTATGNGGVTVGPSALTLGTGTFTITFTSVTPGSYSPTFDVTNSGGTVAGTGASAIRIINIDGGGTAVAEASTVLVTGLSTGSIGYGITLTVTTDSVLTGGETESIALSDGASGTFSPSSLSLNSTSTSLTTVYTPVGSAGARTVTATPTGTPTITAGTLAITTTLPATAVTVSGATLGVAGVAQPLTIGTDRILTGSHSETITFSDAAGGGFSPSSIILDSSTASAIVTYTPNSTLATRTVTATASGTPTLTAGTITIIEHEVNATAITLSGPIGGAVSVASTNFTAAANGYITGTIVVTPSDASGGGTFTPTTVSISAASPTATFTYTPSSSVANHTLTVTNNGGLQNPAQVNYAVLDLPSGGSGVALAHHKMFF